MFLCILQGLSMEVMFPWTNHDYWEVLFHGNEQNSYRASIYNSVPQKMNKIPNKCYGGAEVLIFRPIH